MSNELLQTAASTEAQLVERVLKIDAADLSDQGLDEFNMIVSIVSQFSRINPETGKKEVISSDRARAIPSITSRHLRLVRDARGDLTPDQIRQVWRENMAENTGLRHPDDLFDTAQHNFGTDAPIGDIIRWHTVAAQQREELNNMFQAQERRRWAIYMNERPLSDDRSDAEVLAQLGQITESA